MLMQGAPGSRVHTRGLGLRLSLLNGHGDACIKDGGN